MERWQIAIWKNVCPIKDWSISIQRKNRRVVKAGQWPLKTNSFKIRRKSQASKWVWVLKEQSAEGWYGAGGTTYLSKVWWNTQGVQKPLRSEDQGHGRWGQDAQGLNRLSWALIYLLISIKMSLLSIWSFREISIINDITRKLIFLII